MARWAKRAARGPPRLNAWLFCLQNRSRAAHLEQLQAELSCSKQAHQVQMEQLQGQLHCLQQEMKMCGGPHQDNFCQMQTCEGTQDEQTLDLELLLQQCQLLKDQVGMPAPQPSGQP